jgi:chaperonin GroEL (HSP60 family)
MSVKQVNNNAEVDEKIAALTTNASAIRAIAAAVEGTLGPKGLDTMLVDKFGGVVITNDGVTILELMEVSHPAAKMLINIAKAQQTEIGDGTTTATILAGSLVNNGLEQVIKGVPVTRVIEGMRFGVNNALTFIKEKARVITDLNDEYLKKVALIAGRGYVDIADLVIEATKMVGYEKLLEPNFKLADTVFAQVGANSEVFEGVVINKGRMNSQMPLHIQKPSILIIDDALEPEGVEDSSLGTEAGFNRYLLLQQSFIENISKLIKIGVQVVLVDRGVDPKAEEMLTDANILVVQRVANTELKKAMEHTGAKAIKRTGLNKSEVELEKYLGTAQAINEDEKLQHIKIASGKGKPMATILVGSATDEVVGERERIAKDAASAIQAAVKGGIIPGGGAIELAAALHVEKMRQEVKGMAAYGVDIVMESLRRPLYQIVANAGFNALEKMGDVIAAQIENQSISLAMDCDTGHVVDMWEMGIMDPALVSHALKAAGEVAEAILRIDTIIRMKEFSPREDNMQEFN